MKLVKNLGVFGVVSCAMLAGQFAQAQEMATNPEWANSAWYVGAGVGRSTATIDEERITNSLRAGGATSVMFGTDEKDIGYKLYMGKQLNKNFSVEAGYFNLGEFGFNATSTPGGVLNGDVKFQGVNLDVLGQLPLSERFSVFGRVGVTYGQAKAHFSGNRLFAVTNPNPSENGFNPKLGIGLEYKFTEALAIRGEAERYRLKDGVGNRGDVDLFSINLVYKLGRPAAKMPVTYTAPPAPMPAVVAQAAPTPPPPLPAKPSPVSEKVTFAAEALFDFDKSVLKPQGKVALDGLLAQLAGMDTEVMITVGHTDSVGTDAYNQKLSIRRAEAVKAYLVAKGIDTSRVYTEGKGESQPVADNKTAEGRAKNRRVTVEVVGTRAAK